MDCKLKSIHLSLPASATGHRSDELHASPIPAHVGPRKFYLDEVKKGNLIVPPPLISCSEFVPRKLVELLMRKKKDSALGIKFVPNRNDEITDMEGAMHTFVTPVIGRCEMVGDYRFDKGHGVTVFGDVDSEGGKGKVRLTRSVVLSASIQMDFEGHKVLLRVCKLDGERVVGVDKGLDDWPIISREDKQNHGIRNRYDEFLRNYMVFHLMSERSLPGRKEVKEYMDTEATAGFLDGVILGTGDAKEEMVDKYTELYNDDIVSLELLFNVALHQVRNEFSALEALCPQGYVYTYDPASIFASEIGAEILNRLMLAAVKYLSGKNQFQNMRIVGLNDYADRGIIRLAKVALDKQTKVRVVSKAALFSGVDGKYDTRDFPEAQGSALVIHNNSDGFGQNIETEGPFGSLDGAIGSKSSAAGSLERNRPDLLDFVF
ncbi:hypothetical protein F5882DRAFT_398085 [Hyaloscypha sp. PMI_1271]|nr:hypothetical protein F5882DRAFT_398085 [Hyaloscypha sp. PMI_1271]